MSIEGGQGFWTGAPTVDPVRQFRFRVLINGVFAWWTKTCDKPKVNIPVLGKDEYYLGSNLPDVKPGEIADFQPITMTFVDPSQWGLRIIQGFKKASGDYFPRIGGAAWKAVAGDIVIEQITGGPTADGGGIAMERWALNGAFPTSIDFGSLDYGCNEFVEITITWEYTSFDYTYYNDDEVLVAATPRSTPTSMEEAKKLDGSYT